MASTILAENIVATNEIRGNSIKSSTIITAGSGNNVGVLDGSDATYRIYAGHATPGSAPFRVTQAGALTATSATITGSVTATSGAIGGWTIDSTNGLKLGTTTTTRGISTGTTAPLLEELVQEQLLFMLEVLHLEVLLLELHEQVL